MFYVSFELPEPQQRTSNEGVAGIRATLWGSAPGKRRTDFPCLLHALLSSLCRNCGKLGCRRSCAHTSVAQPVNGSCRPASLWYEYKLKMTGTYGIPLKQTMIPHLAEVTRIGSLPLQLSSHRTYVMMLAFFNNMNSDRANILHHSSHLG